MPRFLPCLLVLVTAQAHAQLPPDKAARTFKVSPGLDYTLWAAEPECINPTSMDIDHRGRVWVCESINYRLKLRGKTEMRQPAGDRILILEDRKGAGQCDTATVFYQAKEIHAPLGVAVYPYPDGKGVKVYVCQSPDILVFEDRDDDGKADGPPSKLLTGFKGFDHDHGVHGVLVGPDNRLYFTVGDSGVQNLHASDGKGPRWTSNATDVRAATVWRCDLDGKNLELIAHNFRNNYEPCVDSFGTVFLSDNDDDGNFQTRICYVMPGGNYGYHPRGAGQTHWHEELPGIVPKIIRTYFGSPTGICMYEGNLLPNEYRGNILHTDAGPRHLRCYHLTPQGAAYAVKLQNIVESSDSWFRPSDVCVAPDGAVFVCDWYDPGVGGHGIGDFTRGRIYRLAPAGNRPSVPAVELSTDRGIRQALASPNLAVRAMAMARIHEIGLPRAVEILTPAATQRDDAVLRARALWQMGKLKHLKLINKLATDPDPRFRVLGIRIMHDTHGQTPERYDSSWLTPLLKDESPHVRRELLLHLQHVDPVKAAPLFYELARQDDGKDRFYLAALGIAAGNTNAKRREAMLADFTKHFPAWSEALPGLIWELRPRGVVAMLAPKLSDAKLSPVERARIADVLGESGDPDAGPVLLAALTSAPAEVQGRILVHLERGINDAFRGLRTSKALADAAQKLFRDPKTRLFGVTLVGIGGHSLLFDETAKIAMDAREPLPVRLAAVRAIGALANASTLNELRTLALDKDQPLPVRLEAVRTLGRDWTWVSATRLMSLIESDAGKDDLAVRQEVVAAAAGHRAGAEYLLSRFQDRKLAGELTADLSRLLRGSPFPDIKKQAQKVMPPPPKLDPKKLPGIAALLARKGNPERGGAVFAASLKNDAACMKCHRIQGEGGNVGPDLSAIGAKASRENLLESILYPDRAVADQYLTWTIETRDGKVFQGILAEEQPDYVVLRDAAIKDYKIATKDIAEKMKSHRSIMPDNLMLYISEEELIDLIDYLSALRGTPGASARRESGHPLLTHAGEPLVRAAAGW